MQTFAIITGSIAIVSVVINIVQWVYRQQEKKSLASNAIDTYCAFNQIAIFCDTARIRFDKEIDPSSLSNEIIRLIEAARGIADAARFSVKAHAQVHLGFTPKYQHPADESEYKVDKYKWLVKHNWFRDSYRENRRKEEAASADLDL